MLVWSYGGGTQTAAIAVLVLQGKLPRPDVVVMADTGREIQSTWDYLDEVIAPGLASIGLEVQIVSHDYSNYDLWKSDDYLLIPAYTTQAGKGKLPTYCSNEWKQRPIRRWLRQQDINDCDVWLGISTDELERMKPSGLNWYRHVYPLIELVPTTRAQCAALVESFGWPSPPKSRCYMCPNQSPLMWSEMRRTQPEEFEKAVTMEIELQQSDPDVYLHRAMIPLEDAVALTDRQPSLFDGCDSGYCFV
jgi:hypothetical protein